MKNCTSVKKRKCPPLQCPHCDSRLADDRVTAEKKDKKIILKDNEGDIVVKCHVCGNQIGITIE
ncbi:MAG: hypothetical protein PHY23_06935 [Oscillospiraceae bacterium]|nr:hypothetical protein [Oscillospiraceae bacterium]